LRALATAEQALNQPAGGGVLYNGTGAQVREFAKVNWKAIMFMHSSSDSRTSPTLLGRLRQAPADQEAWRDFVARYGGRIQHWCRQWHLQEADAHDVTQIVLLKMCEKLAEFAYDPERSFRAWLKKITLNAWLRLAETERRGGRGSGSTEVDQLLQSIAARDDLLARLEEEFDRELLEEAYRPATDYLVLMRWTPSHPLPGGCTAYSRQRRSISLAGRSSGWLCRTSSNSWVAHFQSWLR
jgi:RNA polymerase sigma-70 factor (ECF subfamily)